MKINQSFLSFPFIVFLLLITSSNCFALPFSKTALSYEKWLNQKKWKGGDDIRFLRLDKCFYMNPEFILSSYRDRGVELTFNSRVYMEGYNCRYGFVEISNPQGRKVCLIDEIEFIQSHPISTFDEPKINFKYNNCRWK
jgi:hypothetical protein